jgi:hypothetical protein
MARKKEQPEQMIKDAAELKDIQKKYNSAAKSQREKDVRCWVIRGTSKAISYATAASKL